MSTLVQRVGHARAYVYAGDWVADCPRGCNNVEKLAPKAATFHCSYCHQIAPIDWPTNGDALMEVLARRPIPHTRNWYPADHLTAVKANCPHGQTVKDLLDENNEHGVI